MSLRFCFAAIITSILAIGSAFAQTVPPAPTNLTAVFESPSPNTHGDVKLEWQMSTVGQWRFKVYRSEQDTLHYHLIATPNDRLFRDYMVAVGRRYFYYVRATTNNNPSVEGPRSNVVDILIPAPSPPRRGFIVGLVTDDSSGAPLRHVRMRFYRLPNMWGSPHVMTDSLGHYRAVLDTGRYLVKAEPTCASNTGNYYAEYYNNVREPQQATPVVVGDSTTFTANFGLARIVPPTYSYISGSVRDTAGAPLRHASVSILRTMQNMNALSASGWNFENERDELEGVGHTRGIVWKGYTDSLGNYRARVVAGRYIALASKESYIPEYFNNKPTAQLADIINASQDTSGVNFSLARRPIPQNSVAGIVRDSAGTRVPSRVLLYPARPHPTPIVFRYGHTDSLGAYTLSNVEAGKYFVFAIPFHGYAPAYYKENAYGIWRREQADTVNITGNVTGINVGVKRVNSHGVVHIGGYVRTNTNLPVVGVSVVAMETDGSVAGIGITDATGAYSMDAVVSGNIMLAADRDGYVSVTSDVTIPPSAYNVDNVNMTMTPAGLTTVGGNAGIPSNFVLEQNYPNPFNPVTNFQFSIAFSQKESRRVVDDPTRRESSTFGQLTILKVYDMLGREVATLVNEVKQPGRYEVQWDASNFSSGMYFYRLRSGSFTETKKMILMR